MNEILAALGSYRPVFHNCDGFRRALARLTNLLFQGTTIHTEVVSDLFDRRLDIYYERNGTSVGILLRYPTRRLWTYQEGELVNLPGNSSVPDEAAKYLEDIANLERFVYGRKAVGYCIILTNDHLLWTKPRSVEEYPSIHHGNALSSCPQSSTLRSGNAYPFNWQDYSQLDGENGWFRYCVTSVWYQGQPGI